MNLNRCKNCSLPLENHSLIRLQLCKGELDAKEKLAYLQKLHKRDTDYLRQLLELELEEKKQ